MSPDYAGRCKTTENVTGVTGLGGWMLLDRVKWLWRKPAYLRLFLMKSRNRRRNTSMRYVPIGKSSRRPSPAGRVASYRVVAVAVDANRRGIITSHGRKSRGFIPLIGTTRIGIRDPRIYVRGYFDSRERVLILRRMDVKVVFEAAESRCLIATREGFSR